MATTNVPLYVLYSVYIMRVQINGMWFNTDTGRRQTRTGGGVWANMPGTRAQQQQWLAAYMAAVPNVFNGAGGVPSRRPQPAGRRHQRQGVALGVHPPAPPRPDMPYTAGRNDPRYRPDEGDSDEDEGDEGEHYEDVEEEDY